jgi:hypothetical protein
MVSFFLCGERAFSASALGDPRPTSKYLNYDQIHSYSSAMCETWSALSFLTDRAYCIFYPPHIRIPRNCTSGISHENVSGHKSMPELKTRLSRPRQAGRWIH